jgi:diaminohydroxyphosphoribosylaminopyrimidine deaminase/5-amino-6-(5-phosphoribosylamino)uracil reductase
MKKPLTFTKLDAGFMRLALGLAKRADGLTSPNPMVGAVLVKQGRIVGKGWHRRAGRAHAEIEAIRDAIEREEQPQGSSLYVTLEPCSTFGRTPPCTEAIIRSGIRRVIVATVDPNPLHAGRGLRLLEEAGIEVRTGLFAEEAARLNEAFNHWIMHRTPLVTVKAAMSLDGRIATTAGQSKWITSAKARACGMKLRRSADAVLVGINTVLGDNPRLTLRPSPPSKKLRRIVLDSFARTPLEANVVQDESAALTTIIASRRAPAERVNHLARRVEVWIAPAREGRIDLRWLLGKLGQEDVTSLLVEGGGEVNASFLSQGLAHRVAFFYAPKILMGRGASKAVAGEGICRTTEALRLKAVEWRWLGQDLFLAGRIA